jgi:hypothetical protein
MQLLLPGKAIRYYILCVCVCSFSYPACNVHLPCYIGMWPVQLNHIFPHNLINGMIFRKNIIEHKMCDLIFSTTFV